MSGAITRLVIDERSQDQVKVYLDGLLAFTVPAMAAARLHIGQQLSDSQVLELKAGADEQRAFERAVTLISYRPRSRDEINRHLVRAGFDTTSIERACVRLEKQGMLDDAAFARFWVDDRERFRPRGALALQQELRRKGVDSATIADALGEAGSVESACRAAAGRALRLGPLAQTDRIAFRRKLRDYLLRRGFDSEVVREAIARLERESGANEAGDETAD